MRSLHHFETVGLLAPSRQRNGYRRFVKDDVRRVELIRRLQRAGLSLNEIRDLAPCWRDGRTLSEQHDTEMRDLFAVKLADINGQIATLGALRRELERRLAAIDTRTTPPDREH